MIFIGLYFSIEVSSPDLYSVSTYVTVQVSGYGSSSKDIVNILSLSVSMFNPAACIKRLDASTSKLALGLKTLIAARMLLRSKLMALELFLLANLRLVCTVLCNVGAEQKRIRRDPKDGELCL